MQNNIAAFSIKDLLSLGDTAATTAKAIGSSTGLVLNTEATLSADFSAADAGVRAYQKEIAGRVPKAEALDGLINDTRTWCFRAKDTLKPFLGDAHNSLWRPSGFVNSLRVPEDYDGLVALVGSLAKHLAAHPEQKNENLKVNVTATRANELYDALRAAKSSLDAQDAVLDTRHQEQDAALEALRDRLRGLIGELKQLIPAEDRRWRRFGFNIPAEPETPVQPEQVQANNTTPGQLLVSCAPVPFAERYRFFTAKVGTTAEPAPVGTSGEPLFVIESLEAGGRYNVFVSAVNSSGNEGPRSTVVVAEVLARAAA